jgi:hypothetical protein
MDWKKLNLVFLTILSIHFLILLSNLNKHINDMPMVRKLLKNQFSNKKSGEISKIIPEFLLMWYILRRCLSQTIRLNNAIIPVLLRYYSGWIASTGQTSAQAAQSVHFSGSIT